MASLLAQTPVVILAGGLGKRLESVVADRPKPLAPVGKQSFLEIQLGLLRKQGARQFILCVGHRASQIQALLGDGSSLGVHITYSVERDQLLGTGGALRLAHAFFQPRALVLNGDTYLDMEYERLLAYHLAMKRDHGAMATLALARLDDPGRYGSVLLEKTTSGLASGGPITFVAGFREKDPTQSSGWLNAGVYVIEPAFLESIPQGVPYSIEKEVFPQALAAGTRIAGYLCCQPFYDIGTADDYRRFLQWYEKESSGIPGS